jgi:hypothetical protein
MSDPPLSLPDAPPIAGLAFHTFRGPEEFPGMVAVWDACRPVDGYEWPVSVEDLARTFAHLDHCEPHQDMIFAEVEGETIGYGRGSWYRQPDGTVLHDLIGHVAPVRDRPGDPPLDGRTAAPDSAGAGGEPSAPVPGFHPR